MKGLKRDEVMRRALRARICPGCYLRPVGSEDWPAERQRDCEPNCPIFVHLLTLAQVAQEQAGQRVGAFEHAIQERICQVCTASASAGDFCADRLVRTCPLSRYAPQVLETLERVLEAEHAPTTKKPAHAN